MNFIDFNNKSLEDLKKIASNFPEETIQSIDLQLKNTIPSAFLSTAHYLLSSACFELKDQEGALNNITKSFESATNPEDKIRALVRRSSIYLNNSLSLNAFIDLNEATEISVKNKSINIDLLLPLKLTFVYFLRTKKLIHLIDPLFLEIDSLISLSKNQFIIAHYYKAKGLYYFSIRDFQKHIACFNSAKTLFQELNLREEIQLLNQHYTLSKFILGNSEYINHLNEFKKFLDSKKDATLNLRYLISICNENIDPFQLLNINQKEYLRVVEISQPFSDYKSTAKLFLSLSKHFENAGDFNKALTYFKESNIYSIKHLEEAESDKVIEEQIQIELKSLFHFKDKKQKNSNNAKKDLNVIQDYVSSNINPTIISEPYQKNSEIIGRLILDQFKTQVSICTNYGIKFLETNNIQVLESDGNYTILYDKDAKRHISSKPLAYYEKQLDPKSFLRTHRSYIININYIVHFFPGRVGKIELTNGQIIEVSARKMAEVRRRILS
ncbi:MAG: LytTR family transcriptional regulator [Bacteroidetes bacterium]|nr:LytTR family transcriptional regulator [Bacteroidota bacterium]